MTEQRIRTYEKLLEIILIIAMIAGLISCITGCAKMEVDTRIVIDYCYTEAHTETTKTITENKTEYCYSVFVPEKYELFWEYTYKDGHKERKWEECTRFEYEKAKEELGE